MSDIRFVLRGLLRTPLFTVTAVLSLALGIGANTAMFSLIDRVLLQRLPVKEPGRLAFLYHPGPLQGSSSTDEDGGPSFSYPMFREMQRDQTAFAASPTGTTRCRVRHSWCRATTFRCWASSPRSGGSSRKKTTACRAGIPLSS